MLNFEEIINSCDKDQQLSLILGNGFSQAWNAEIFNYLNLFEKADFGLRNETIRALFDSLKTYDFEVVSRHLCATETILKVYDPTSELIQSISSDIQLLKNSLITAISNTHPDKPSEITDEQYVSVRTFLSQFNNIFSINYDLLFYWARNKKDLDPKDYKTDDGFRSELRWEGYGTDQNIYFLHGGLHIYDADLAIKKHAFKCDGTTIIDQVRNNLNDGKFPLFVSEPTWEKKKKRIAHNPYLNYCYRALGELTGILFIHGHSMDENDKHIFKQIKSSRVSKIFISIFGNEDTDANIKTKANAREFLAKKGIKVKFYQAESAPVWYR
ncbi:DUF4917 family protein [Orbus wheelerorum]|uniref:DUF4917 family protein n=1 Tax=Orbus wheelerorum TaxID=3074111 RepID=UPI00370D6FCF